MSMSYYLDLWKTTQDDLRSVIDRDQLIKKKGPIQDPETAKWLIGHLYMNYVRIVKKLDKCYDQIVHPQKRELIGRLLDCSFGRLLEVKREIFRIEMDDYYFFDNILIELKLTPDDMQLPVPDYFWRDREKNKAHRRELIKQVYEELKEEKFKQEYLEQFPEEEREQIWVEYLQQREAERNEKLKLELLQKKRIQAADMKPIDVKVQKRPEEVTDAVLLIQRHERARQARRQLPIHKRRRVLRQTGIKDDVLDAEISDKAATVIQQHWRRRKRRIMKQIKLEKEFLLLGMIQPSWQDKSYINKVEEVLRYRREMQEKNQEEYENALETIKTKMMKLYSPAMNEDTTDEIRYWFEFFFLKTDSLPDYPGPEPIIPTGEILGIPKKISQDFIEKSFPAKKKQPVTPLPRNKMGLELNGMHPLGGSALIVAEHWIGPKEFLICQKELERIKKSGKKDEKKKLSKEEKLALKKKEKEAEKKRLAAEEAEGFRLRESEYLRPLLKADKDYRDYWLDLDESKNYEQRYVYDIIKDNTCWELSVEVRQIVDEAMRIELEILKEALERDKHPKKKKKKPKKSKGKKGKKKKTKKDPTGDRTVDDLFKELFKNGIIREYEEAHLRDIIGERSYSAYEMRRRLEDGTPSLGDVKDLLLQLCILPLGSPRIHQLSPVIRSVCLLGPEHTGKEFLARVVCTETASIMFDLTPENTAGKYTTKADAKMLLHLVEKMSRILQPSVIFVDGAEKLFYKKVPKEEKKFEPKRFGKLLTKVVKGIKEEDQVLVLGVSSFPWLCPKPKLSKTYDKFIIVPFPNYDTYYILWQTLLNPYHSLPRDFDFSCLAKASTGHSVKTIMDVIKKVLSPNRIAQARVNPYKPADFVEELCQIQQINEKILSKTKKYIDNTEPRKKRLKMLEETKLALEKAKKK